MAQPPTSSAVSRVVWQRDPGTAPRPSRGLRSFGLVQTPVLVVVGAVLRYGFGHVFIATVLWVLAAITLLLALFAPRWLAPGRALAQRLGALVGRGLTVLLLTPIFYLLFGGVGLVLRWLGRDPLALRIDPAASSYWVPRTRVAPPREYAYQFRVEDRDAGDAPEARR